MNTFAQDNSQLCFEGTRMPVHRLFQELGSGASTAEFSERYDISLETIQNTLWELSTFFTEYRSKTVTVGQSNVVITINNLGSELARFVKSLGNRHEPATTEHYQERETNNNIDPTTHLVWERD